MKNTMSASIKVNQYFISQITVQQATFIAKRCDVFLFKKSARSLGEFSTNITVLMWLTEANPLDVYTLVCQVGSMRPS